MDKLKWGILGTGFAANLRAQAIKASDHNILTAVASRDPGRAQQFATTYEIKNHYSDYQSLLDDKHVDVVHISLPNALHMEWVVQAARAGKHILCEKPFALDAMQTEKAFAEVEKAGVFCMESFPYRSHPQTQKIIELVQKKVIGDILLTDADFSMSQKGLGKHSIHWQGRLGSGAIMDLGCYCVSMARLIAGKATGKDFLNPIKCVSEGTIDKTKGVDLCAYGVLKFNDMDYATIKTSLQHQSVKDTYGLTITGTKGVINIPNPWLMEPEGMIQIQRFDDRSETISIDIPISLHTHEVNVVANCILSGKMEAESPAHSWSDTLGNMQVLDAWRKAIGLTFPSPHK